MPFETYRELVMAQLQQHYGTGVLLDERVARVILNCFGEESVLECVHACETAMLQPYE